jgi:hypothetical protein
MTGENDLDMLTKEDLPSILNEHDEYPKWFEQDGSRYSSVVGEWLGERFLQHSTKRRQPRSPDLTPLDFYLWGQLKVKVRAVSSIFKSELL